MFSFTVDRVYGLECYDSVSGGTTTVSILGSACVSCFTFTGFAFSEHRTYILYLTCVIAYIKKEISDVV